MRCRPGRRRGLLHSVKVGLRGRGPCARHAASPRRAPILSTGLPLNRRFTRRPWSSSWRASSSITCRASPKPMAAARRSSTTSTSPSTRTPRSACSARTARANRRCCGSWPGSTRSSAARRGSPRARRSATCRRSRSSTPTKDVLGNVMEGVAGKQAILDRYNELMMNYSDETAEEATKLQDEIDAKNLWDLDLQGRDGDGRAGCPPERRRRDEALRRREAPRGALPAASVGARPAAPRRADQPSRRGIGGVARKAPARISRLRADRHPRPLLPRQCHRLDPRARPRPRHPL